MDTAGKKLLEYGYFGVISLLSWSNPLKLTFIEKNDAIGGIFDGAVDVGDNEMGPTGFFYFEKFHNYRLDAKFGMMTPANKLMPIPAAEKARLVSTLVNGSPDEVGRAIKGLESWNIKTDLLKDDTTPMDIIINEISKDIIKQTEKTGDRSALALLWYGDNDLKRGTLMKYLKTPISADNSSLKKEEVNKAIEKVMKPYTLGFEKQADLAGGAGNWIM